MSSETPRRKRSFHSANVAVIGLGRFGSSLATELVNGGHQVLGIDTDEKIVQALSTTLTHVVSADTTDEETLRELGIQDMDSAVVAIGADLEASILTASLLLQLGVKQVWAKANSTSHGRILEQLGVHHVIFPEKEMDAVWHTWSLVSHSTTCKLMKTLSWSRQRAQPSLMAKLSLT